MFAFVLEVSVWESWTYVKKRVSGTEDGTMKRRRPEKMRNSHSDVFFLEFDASRDLSKCGIWEIRVNITRGTLQTAIRSIGERIYVHLNHIVEVHMQRSQSWSVPHICGIGVSPATITKSIWTCAQLRPWTRQRNFGAREAFFSRYSSCNQSYIRSRGRLTTSEKSNKSALHCAPNPNNTKWNVIRLSHTKGGHTRPIFSAAEHRKLGWRPMQPSAYWVASDGVAEGCCSPGHRIESHIPISLHYYKDIE